MREALKPLDFLLFSLPRETVVHGMKYYSAATGSRMSAREHMPTSVTTPDHP